MVVQLTIPYEKLIELVDQLPEDKRAELLAHLLEKIKTQSLTIAEKKVILDGMVVDLGEVSPGYSDRREDWYDDDGR